MTRTMIEEQIQAAQAVCLKPYLLIERMAMM